MNKTDSFEFSQMKDEIECPSSAQLPTIDKSTPNNVASNTPIDNGNISNKEATWMERFDQMCDRENDLWRQNNPEQPGTSRSKSTIKISKLNREPEYGLGDDDSCQEDLYPSDLEKDFLGSQHDISYFKSCLKEKDSQQNKMKSSDSIYEINKSKKSKHELVVVDDDDIIYDDEENDKAAARAMYNAVSGNRQKKGNESNKKQYLESDIYDNEIDETDQRKAIWGKQSKGSIRRVQPKKGLDESD
jgi:hypothetical protein